MNYKRQLNGLNRVKWEKKSEKEKAKYIEKKLDILGYKIPTYIKNGKVNNKQLQSNLNKIEKGLTSRVNKESTSNKVNINSQLSSVVEKYNKKLENIQNKIIKNGLLNSNVSGLVDKQALKYLQGNDLFYASRKKSFIRDDFTLKKMVAENQEFASKKDKQNFINSVKKMTRDLKYKDVANSITNSQKSDNWFAGFLNAEFNQKITENEKGYLWRYFNQLTPIQKELYIKGELDHLRETYENAEDGGDLDKIGMNVFNRILNTIEDYR